MDFIEQAPVHPRDAIVLTDVRTHTVYIFHRRDVQASLLANLSQADDMLPTPRAPTNPYTNEPLSLAQTISVCVQLNEHAVRRGRCVPVLLAAFWAARFDLERFAIENAYSLAHAAIHAFFAEISDSNRGDVCDTIIQLLTELNLHFSSSTVFGWLQEYPATNIQREWLTLVRDYTLYMNLHVQPRPAWSSEDAIHDDVRELYDRSWCLETASASTSASTSTSTSHANTLASLMTLALFMQQSHQPSPMPTYTHPTLPLPTTATIQFQFYLQDASGGW